MSLAAAASLPLYRRLAGDYAQAMGLGTLQAGERMPSVRELMRRHQVSLSTALQMLRHLDVGGCTPLPELFDHRFLNKTVARLLREHPQLLTQGRSLLANQGNHPLFQQAMARHALAAGIRVAPGDVLATTGNSEAVSLALAAPLLVPTVRPQLRNCALGVAAMDWT